MKRVKKLQPKLLCNLVGGMKHIDLPKRSEILLIQLDLNMGVFHQEMVDDPPQWQCEIV
jgi:hypothetical protein